MQKKKHKRIWAGIVSAMMVGTLLGSMPMSASAAMYGDINGNGSINLSDAIIFRKFLVGQYTLNDYTVADLNLNYVIDDVDCAILSDFLIGAIDYLPYTG